MLKTTLLHPDILRICARAGHHSKVLIADGNYPAATRRGSQAELVCLQLSPGVPTVAQVLRALLSALPVDALNTMGIPPDDPYAKFGEPPAWKEYRALAKETGIALVEPIAKWEFYKAVESPDHVLTIQTADQALWANVLLTIGCRTPDK
jgi:L-fucose mutarotase